MKHLLSFLLAASFLLTCAAAHGGKTDANGGHTDHSTGEYHYHHGYPAHQHTNGTCPYDFDDQTGQNSGTPGGGGSKTTTAATTKVTTISKTASVATTSWTSTSTVSSPASSTQKEGDSMSYELFRDDPAEFFILFLVNLILTLFIYGAFPLIFAKCRKKTIAEKRFKRICYLINGVVCCFSYIYSGEALNLVPYLLWTGVFSAQGIKILKSNDIFTDYCNCDPISINTETIDLKEDFSRFTPASDPNTETVTLDSDVSCSNTDNLDNESALKKKLRNRTILFVILLLIFMATCGNYMIEAYQMNKQLETEKEMYTSLLSDYNDLVYSYNDLQSNYYAHLNKYEALRSDYNKAKLEYNFYHDNAVIAVVNGHNYHKYGCDWVRGKDFYIYNKENAIYKGLEPCYDCYYEDIEW